MGDQDKSMPTTIRVYPQCKIRYSSVTSALYNHTACALTPTGQACERLEHFPQERCRNIVKGTGRERMRRKVAARETTYNRQQWNDPWTFLPFRHHVLIPATEAAP